MNTSASHGDGCSQGRRDDLDRTLSILWWNRFVKAGSARRPSNNQIMDFATRELIRELDLKEHWLVDGDATGWIGSGSVTTCIAAICPAEKTIVTISDLSLTDIEPDHINVQYPAQSPKMSIVSPSGRWVSLFSDDLSEATMIWSMVREDLALSKDDRADSILDAHRRALRKRLNDKRETALSADQFILDKLPKGEDGRILRAEFCDKMVKKAAGVEVKVNFLLAGFDQHDNPRLFTICPTGDHAEHTRGGFAAIGSGRYYAKMSLVLRLPTEVASREVGLDELIYHLCFAKFDSESSSFVGKETLVTVHNAKGEWRLLSDRAVAAIREEWGRPKILPAGILEVIKTSLSNVSADKRGILSRPRE